MRIQQSSTLLSAIVPITFFNLLRKHPHGNGLSHNYSVYTKDMCKVSHMQNRAKEINKYSCMLIIIFFVLIAVVIKNLPQYA